MEPTLGWVLLSRDALSRAEAHLRENDQGVRDEIGFLALHQAYANRFFPGTSVLQTRLRYILFVPWLYLDAARNSNRVPIHRRIQQKEVALAGRLKKVYGASQGVIGARTYPKPTSQPPSMVYWTALSAWGILRPMRDGTYPSRAATHRILSRSRTATGLRDDDKIPLEVEQSVFVALPARPGGWARRTADLTFDLTDRELEFLQQQLVAVTRPEDTSPCLLARLAEHGLPDGAEVAWSDAVRSVAEEDDRHALVRAGQAAALAAIGRGVYAALVEQICQDGDGRPVSTRHRAHLNQVIQEYKTEAIKLDMAKLEEDAQRPLPRRILGVLCGTQKWLDGTPGFESLRETYQDAEIARKGRRARLAPTLFGKERRAEWSPEEHPLAEPLHYRWRNVKRLLGDLHG
jgi:hypothetical protein